MIPKLAPNTSQPADPAPNMATMLRTAMSPMVSPISMMTRPATSGVERNRTWRKMPANATWNTPAQTVMPKTSGRPPISSAARLGAT